MLIHRALDSIARFTSFDIQSSRDLINNISVKALNFLATGISVYYLAASEPVFIEISYLLVILLFLRAMDFGFQYMRRINASRGIFLLTSQLYCFYIVFFALDVVVLYVLDVEKINIALIALARYIHFELFQLAHLRRKTYLLALAIPVSTVLVWFAFLILNNTQAVSASQFVTLFFILNVTISGLCAAILFFNKSDSLILARLSLFELYNRSIFYYSISNILYSAAVYVTQIAVYNRISEEEFSILNIFRRLENILISISSVISNISWNQNLGVLSGLDRRLINIRGYVFFTSVTFPVILFLAVGQGSSILLLLYPLLISSMFTYFCSQILLRKERTAPLLFVAFVEAILVLSAAFNVHSLSDLISFMAVSQVIKVYFFWRDTRLVTD